MLLRNMSSHQVPRAGLKRPAVIIATLAVVLSGCSADVGRFDLNSGLGANDKPTRTASIPTPSEPLRRNAGIPVDNDTYGADRGAAGGAYVPPPPRDQPVQMSGLPDTAARPAPIQTSRAPQPGALPAQRGATPAPAVASSRGETIEVQQGDTLYGLSKRYRVSISELMSANQLSSPAIKPGQKLVIPGNKRAVQRTAAATRPAEPAAAAPPPAPIAQPAAPRAIAPAPAATVDAPGDWNGSYTVASGDSLYGIARRHKIPVAKLQSVNGITDPTKVRPGTVLKVPGDGAPAPAAVAERAAPQARTAPIAAAPAPAPAAPTGIKSPTIINASPDAAPAQSETKVAALGSAPSTSDAAPNRAENGLPEPPKVSTATKFRWPVKGKVIGTFGPRPDNSHNDGINISVPQGTDVHAAENGVVAYAGNELKGYGNLVLVRHENNWVSAYAHNDQLLVKRGDKVKRGQTIAKAGATGTVDQPQVHFELRQGSKPVDPLPYMEKN